jgi:predicted esterase
MACVRYARRFALEPFAKGAPEALVVLLLDLGSCKKTLAPIAARWATAVPGAALLALDCQILLSCDRFVTPDDAETGSERAILAYATRLLEPLLALELHSRRLNPARLVLVGFGFGARLALHLLLERGASCAGVLTFGARMSPLVPGNDAAGSKVRLIERATQGESTSRELRDFVESLRAGGLDARAALAAGSVLSDAAIRHGTAYLVELVATAQRGNGFRARHAPPIIEHEGRSEPAWSAACAASPAQRRQYERV